MEVSVDITLRNKILRFYKDNPDEGLTADDMFVKFCFKKTRWILEDVLYELQDAGILDYRDGLYCFVAAQPKDKPKKKPKKKPSEWWKPPKLRPQSIRIAPMWMVENLQTPWQRYKAPKYVGEDKVREFWNRVAEGRSCELWCDTATGEKELIGLFDKPYEGWVPLMRSNRGEVSFAMTNYTFQTRK